MIAAILFFGLQIIFGFLIFDFFDPDKKMDILERAAAGSVVGLLISGFIILIFSLIPKALNFGIVAFLIIFFVVFFYKIKSIRDYFKKLYFEKPKLNLKEILNLKNLWAGFLILIFSIYCFYISIILHYGKNNTLMSSTAAWGDNAWHIDLIKRLAIANPLNLVNPGFAGTNLMYPFMVDFFSAIYFKLGADFILAFRLPLILFGVCGLFLLFSFASKILKSKNFAVLALVLILLGSGFGFFTLFKDISQVYQDNKITGVIGLFLSPLHEYTHLDGLTGITHSNENSHISWIVPIVSFLAHQRSFTIGVAIFSLLLLAIYYYGESEFFWRYGLLAGLLPFCHTDTFLTIFLMCSVLFWFFLKNWLAWIKFALAVLVISLPQIIFLFFSGINTKSFFRPWFGWMVCEHTSSWFFCPTLVGSSVNIFYFWLENFGIIFAIWVFFMIASVAYLFNEEKNFKFNYRFICASFILFLIPNLFLFHPWDFDNNKILFYWWILAILFCVVPFLQSLFKKGIVLKIIVIIIVFFSILAGGFDFAEKIFMKNNSWGYSDSYAQKVEAAKWIFLNTSTNAIFLAGPSIDPVPLFMAGRPVYSIYDGWLWSWGLDSQKQELIEQNILSGSISLACKNSISYIFLDDTLINFYPKINTSYLLDNTKTVFSAGQDVKILKVICR